MNPLKAIIHSNIYISLASLLLTVSAQIQLGMPPQWHPYLFLIFFATLFEYNLHRLITVLTNNEALKSDKHRWVRENRKMFYMLVFISVAGFITAAGMAKKEVLLAFLPLGIITLFYSVPVSGNRRHLLRLREIPYLKIVLIAAVWSASTVLLPVIQTDEKFNSAQVILLLVERFFFIVAITIPFDIRDMEADRHSGLKTLPMILGEKNARSLSYLSLILFFLISALHYPFTNQWYIIVATGISAITTYLFIGSTTFRKLNMYHYEILDGTMLLQSLLVLGLYFVTHS
ncbi:MAG: UbiA family prenyltransferase [Prolixibacteraceae bacterium]|nr:UbiA family prenyltransferase [Prolixibacteraceae bacterium]